MINFKKIIYSIIASITIIITIFSEITVILQMKKPLFNDHKLFIILFAGIIYFALIVGIFFLIQKKSHLYFLGILAIASIPKLIIINYLTLIPMSDMWTYDFEAKMRLANYSWHYLFNRGWLDISNMSPHVFHISSFYQGTYWLTGITLTSVQILNVVLSALSAYLIYSIVKFCFGNNAGILASLIFFFTPSNYIYSVQIGAEYIQIFAILTSIYFFIRIFDKKYSNTVKQQFIYMALSLLAMIIAELIKPNILIYGIAYLGFTIFTLIKNNYTKLEIKHITTIIGIILCTFTILSFTSNKIDQFIYQMPIANRSVETNYTLATGFNYKSDGMYSYDIVQKINKINHSKLYPNEKFSRWNKYLIKKRNENFKYLKDNSLFIKFLQTKLGIFIDSRYGFKLFHFQYKKYFHQSNNYLLKFYSGTILIFCFAYQAMLLLLIAILSMISLIKLLKIRNIKDLFDMYFFASMLNIGVLITSLVTEIQPRYQTSMYVPWYLLLGISCGIIQKYRNI